MKNNLILDGFGECVEPKEGEAVDSAVDQRALAKIGSCVHGGLPSEFEAFVLGIESSCPKLTSAAVIKK